MNKRKMISLLLALVMVLCLVLAGCGGDDPAAGGEPAGGTTQGGGEAAGGEAGGETGGEPAGEKYSFRVKTATMGAENSGQNMYATPRLDEKLAELSNQVLGYDAFEVSCEFGGSYGSDEGEYIEMVGNGMLEQYTAPVASLLEYDSENTKMNIFDLPIIFKGDSDLFFAFSQSELCDEIYDHFEATNPDMILNPCNVQGWNVIATAENNPITKVADLKGLKIRAQNAPILISICNSLGMSPTSVAISELYTAAMQGTVDGLIANSNVVAALKLQEVCPNVLKYGLNAAGQCSLVNKEFLASMPDELYDGVYEIMTTGLAECYNYAWARSTEVFDKDLEKFYVEPTDALRADLDSTLGGILDEFADKAGGAEYIKSVQDWVAAYEG